MSWRTWFTCAWAPAHQPAQPAAPAHPPLACDECVTDPVRIRQLLNQIMDNQASVILMGRDLVPVLARALPADPASHRVNLRIASRGRAALAEVTAMTQLDGIDVFFSTRAHPTETGTCELDMPDELLYLNMRGHFRANGMASDETVLHTASGQTLNGQLVNVSEGGICVALSPLEANRLKRADHPLRAELTLNGQTLSLSALGVCHLTAAEGCTHVGLSFQLPEGAARQALRTVLNQRHIANFNSKKSYSRFSSKDSLLSSL